MTTVDTLARLLSLRVDLRDEAACAEISPEMTEKYLRAKGWTLARTVEPWNVWERGGVEMAAPTGSGLADYGRRMVDAIGGLAYVEERSPIAVWVDMMAQKETAA